MPIRNSPFLRLSPDNYPRPWLPVKIINPHTGLHVSTFGLIDTGADECTVPAYFANELGHDLDKGTPKPIATAGGEILAYSHTTKIEVLDINSNNVVFSISDTPIDFVNGLHCLLLGVRKFLDQFNLEILYPQSVFSVKNP